MKLKYKKNSLYAQMIGLLSNMNKDEIINLFDTIDNKEVEDKFFEVLSHYRKKE